MNLKKCETNYFSIFWSTAALSMDTVKYAMKISDLKERLTSPLINEYFPDTR